MILKRNFNPFKVIRYVGTELLVAVSLSSLVFVLHKTGTTTVTLPFSIAAILGSALAIFIAFRNNTSYARWWEARTLWANISTSSRIFARQIIANADNALATGKVASEAVAEYKREMILRQIAFAHALRLHLRNQNSVAEFRHLLSEQDFTQVCSSNNIPCMLLLRQGIRVKEGMRAEILGAFDNISLEPTLGAFNNFQGACERIKTTPLLKQYDFFTRLFLYVFMLLLPFSLVGDFAKMNIDNLMIPVSVVIAFVFATIGKVGEVNENPFENRITDVPMTAICTDIERDLKEMLGERNLPERIAPKDGFLM